MDFPKLKDTEFPNLETVDVYAFKNDFDFKRFDNAQMTIHVLNVPWDMGEAHVGQRTITGIGNVVKFENDEERDAWFNSKKYASTPEQWATGSYDGFKWVTKYRHFHNGDELKIPLPFDVVARFNYAFITYEPAPTAENPVNYEYGGLLKWFLFIRNFQMLSVNTTACTVKRDTWQTYINHMKFKGMMFEQGHYPFSLTDVDSYLNNPLENNSGLLEPDVVYGDLAKVTHSNAVVLNEQNIKAVIVSSGNPTASWGTKSANTWNTPDGFTTISGQPSYYAFAINPSNLNAFINNANSATPQFIQTIKAVFFISEKLIKLGGAFTFNSVSCNWVLAQNSEFDVLTLNKEQFRYDDKYKHLAKLYTYPYSAIEITKENGDVTLLKVEETAGAIKLQTSVNIAFPWINIDGRLAGIGGNDVNTLTFRNVDAHTFSFSGRWYETIYNWNVPTFAVLQSGADYNNYATHFDREQQNFAAAQTYANATEQNATANTNALATNATAKTNVDANADLLVTNTAVQNAANSANTSATNSALNSSTSADNNLNETQTSLSNTVTSVTTNNEVDAKNASAALGAIGAVGNGAVSGAAAGMAMGPPGAAIGAAVGAVGGAIGSVSNIAQTAVSNNLLESQAAAQMRANGVGGLAANATNLIKTETQTTLNSTTTANNNSSASAQASNTAGVMKANASRDKSTGDANANRDKATGDNVASRNLAISNSAVANSIKQAALNAPMEFGEFANGETATTKPMALFANVITQNKDAIEKTGDQFLRYGYAYNKFIEFEDFNIMPKFTYWKCSDVWIYDLDMADEHCDEIRFFLMGGVTVWRKPEYIGTTSIYENV